MPVSGTPELDRLPLDQALSAVDDRLCSRPGSPAEDPPGLLGPMTIAPAERGHDPTERRVEEPGREPDDEVRQLARRHPLAFGAEFGAQREGDVAHPHELARRQEPLSGSLGRGHGPDVYVGEVPDV